jgi:hypothetical protein
MEVVSVEYDVQGVDTRNPGSIILTVVQRQWWLWEWVCGEPTGEVLEVVNPRKLQ